MPVYRAQVAAWKDTLEPRDAMVVTPHFKDDLTSDPETICDDIANVFQSFYVTDAQIQVKLYNAEDVTPPAFPVAETKLAWGTVNASAGNREDAVCLSFYKDNNIPSQRGRLYLPVQLLQTGELTGPRLSSTIMTKAAALVPLLAGIGGVDVSWGVWSRKNSQFHKATHWFVDNAIDTVRSRGLAADSRITGTTGG